MNVLVMVVAMIMVIAAATYSRVHTFATGALVRSSLASRLEKDLEGERYQRALGFYVEHKASSGSRDPAESFNDDRYLHIGSLFSDTAAPDYDFMLAAFKGLVERRYGKMPWYQEAITDNPVIIEDLLASIRDSGVTVTSLDKLAELPIADEALKLFAYRLFVGKSDGLFGLHGKSLFLWG